MSCFGKGNSIHKETLALSYTLEHKYQKLPPALLSTLSSARVQCWAEYEEQVHATECLEKDCKIDWLAIQKIECYLDVLLHDVSKKEFLTKCDSETCMNVACEGDYKHCASGLTMRVSTSVMVKVAV